MRNRPSRHKASENIYFGLINLFLISLITLGNYNFFFADTVKIGKRNKFSV